MPATQLWIGLVKLKPRQRKAGDWAGAFTNIVTWASDPQSFRRKAEIIASTLDLDVVDVEDPEPLKVTPSRLTLTEEIDEMALRAESNPDAILYSTFHTFRLQ